MEPADVGSGRVITGVPRIITLSWPRNAAGHHIMRRPGGRGTPENVGTGERFDADRRAGRFLRMGSRHIFKVPGPPRKRIRRFDFFKNVALRCGKSRARFFFPAAKRGGGAILFGVGRVGYGADGPGRSLAVLAGGRPAAARPFGSPAQSPTPKNFSTQRREKDHSVIRAGPSSLVAPPDPPRLSRRPLEAHQNRTRIRLARVMSRFP